MSETARRVVKSEALDAFTAKNRLARRMLQRHFIAFVRMPLRWRKKEGTLGYVFYATDSQLALYGTSTFNAFLIGSPSTVVRDVRDVIQALHEQSVRVTSEEDVHGTVILAELKDYNKAVLEDKEEPRPNTVETLIFDERGHFYWCAYDGMYAGQELKGNGDPITLRGCYDKMLYRGVRAILRRRCLGVRPNKASLRAAVSEIRKLVRLPKVGYVPIT